MAKETDKLKMVDIKFDDRFLNDLWSMRKTCTTRKSKKGDVWDRFIVTYGDTDMEFEITNVTHCKKMTLGIAREIYEKEGFRTPHEFIEYLDNKGYTEDMYIHDFRMVSQHLRVIPVKSDKERRLDNAKAMTEISNGIKDILHFRLQTSDALRMKEWMERIGFPPLSFCNGKFEYPDKPVVRKGYGFDTALGRLKSGYRQQREGWNGKGMYIELQVPDEHSKMSRPYLYIKSVDGDLVPWVASQTDLLGDDWKDY